MRASIGLGFIAIGLVACAADQGDVSTEQTAPATLPTPDGEEGSSESPATPQKPVAPEPPKDPADPDTPPAPIVSGLAITDVAVFQAVKVPVVQDGELVQTTARKAPVVAKRPGIVRVYVTPNSSWTPRAVTAELRLVGTDKKFPIIRETKAIGGPSKDEDPTTTFNLEVPAESLPPGVTFNVALTAPDGEDPETAGDTEARYPRDGSFQDIGAQLSGQVHVVLVPVKYDADGSGRVPEVGDAQLELYKRTMMRLYPTSEVTVSTHAPFPWSSQISSGGNGFSTVLRGITQLREDDNVAPDVYYYGIFAPKPTMAAYCPSGCVTGLSPVIDDPEVSSMRASVGIGFPGQISANTMAHEIGHAHGRRHAPCGGPQGTDPRFPYRGGAIGVWGYDIFAKTFIAPTTGKDIMGYCRNEWVSDYTYSALFERIATVSTEKRAAPPGTGVTPDMAPKQAARYRVATASGSGDLTWDGDLDLREELKGGALRQVAFIAESGATLITRAARYFPFDHLPGGFVFIPKDGAIDAVKWKAVQVEGFAHALDR